uniref:Major facilitator superfamily (MFS) profile domain-containing protein n=1 Tax=Aegilops tauschii subsp. strangulata TaxID=200361 RepID=A0A453J537_AEGTS
MIAAIPNIIGWLAISLAKDTTFLYMGRLLEGFGVGIISYTVRLTTLCACLFLPWKIYAASICLSCSKKRKKDQEDVGIVACWNK